MTRYSYEEMISAYFLWVSTRIESRPGEPVDYSLRNDAWDRYCDIRDNLAFGTSKTKRTTRTDIGGTAPVLPRKFH